MPKKIIIQKISNTLLLGVVSMIRLYQITLSPFLPQHCRFYPTCSSYALEAFKQHGLWRGLLLTTNRIKKCHPWHQGGYDPVPQSAITKRTCTCG